MGPVSQDPPDQDHPAGTPLGVVEPGHITTLLRELVAAAESSADVGWAGMLAPGAVVGRFELLNEIGRGGFGVVWEAHDSGLNRNVAFKAVRSGMRAPVREERLLAEAEATARLAHPNLVTLYDVGRTERGAYLVYELLRGETLSQRLTREPIDVREVLRISVEIAKGVAHAHARGVLHRDLKPANVMLCSDGQVKILDFGLAHAFGWRLTAGGTPAYMAPEQEAGGPEDERTDVYAMGAMLRRMLTGEHRPNHPSGSGGEVTQERPLPGAPETHTLGRLAARMLERDPDRRPRDGSEVLAALLEVEADLARAAEARASARRRRRLAAAIAAGVLASAAVAGLVVYRVSAPRADLRSLVAVADFANETRDPDLDGLSGLLITSLEQSRSLRVLTRGRMIDLLREMGKGDAPRIDESLARDVGRRARVRTLFLASIRKLGETYAAELRAINPQHDEYLFTLTDDAATKDEIIPLIGRMSERARLALREPDADVRRTEVSLADAVTPSLEAYRHYFLGKDLAARGRLETAVDEYEEAVRIAPRFAMAKLEIAWIGYFSGSRTRAAAHELVRSASLDATRAPDKEASLIRILDAFFSGQFARSREEIHALDARYAEDRDVAVLTAEVLWWAGEVEGALPYFERALRLAPDWDVLRLDYTQGLYYVGRGEEARSKAEAAARQRPTPLTLASAGVASYLAGDVEAGTTSLRAAGNDISLVRMFLAQGLAAQGRVEEALASLGAADDSVSHVARAQVLAYSGRLREGLAEIEAARRPGTDLPFNRQVASWYLAAAGNLDGARRIAKQGDFFTVLDGIMLATVGDQGRLGELMAQVGPETQFQGRFLQALAALSAKDRTAALADLRALDRKGGASFVSYFRGLAASQEGLDEEAVECFARFERPVLFAADGYLAPWLLARARFLAARSLDRLGRQEEARRILDLQLERWKNADPDLPLVAEMKALRTQLGSPAR